MERENGIQLVPEAEKQQPIQQPNYSIGVKRLKITLVEANDIMLSHSFAHDFAPAPRESALLTLPYSIVGGKKG